MRTKGSIIGAATWVIALTLGVGLSPARADPGVTGTLILGSHYDPFGGGSFDTATWNTRALGFLYCVDIPDNVYLSYTYDQTIMHTDGEVAESRKSGAKTMGYVGWDDSHALTVTIAGSIAYLLDKYGWPYGYGPHGIDVQQAIWILVYATDLGVVESHHGISPPTAQAQLWAADAALHSDQGVISSYMWFSPLPGVPTDPAQAQVGHFVPDGGMTLVLLGGALVGLETLRRRCRI